jgi:hypothetical protein
MIKVISSLKFRFSPDQWNVYLDYVTSVFRLIDADKLASDGIVDDPDVDWTVEAARKFIVSQQQKNEKCRGPRLAELELQCRLLARRDEAAKESEFLCNNRLFSWIICRQITKK